LNFPGFYWQIIKTWFELKEITNKNKNETTALEIRKEVIWLYKYIVKNKKEIYWQDWHKKGITFIHDIVNSKGQFLSPNEINQNYNLKCDILKYNTLKDVIPTEWRTFLKTTEIPDDAISKDDQISLRIDKTMKSLNQITNKDAYWIFIINKKTKPIIIYKMQQNYDIPEDAWDSIFTMAKVVRDTKI
jgi:hypothetical protein